MHVRELPPTTLTLAITPSALEPAVAKPQKPVFLISPMSAPSRMIRPLQPPSKVHFIPVEILSEIFLLAVQGQVRDQWKLMLVCWRWYDTMLSTPGMHSEVRIHNSTQKEDVQAAMRGRRWLLNIVIKISTESIRPEFNADVFHACFMAAAQEASRWRIIHLYSLPPPDVCHSVQILQPLEHLEYFGVHDGCDVVGFFELLMTAITTTATPHLREMYLGNSGAVLYLVRPSCVHVFHSLRKLRIWLPKRMERPVDILPHLQRLETFAARHLFLPIYPPDVHLPLIQTLSQLSLKSVSIQWMAGHVFPALEYCSIRFPPHVDTTALQPVSMPSCTGFKYKSNDLGPLRYFHHTRLDSMTVKCRQWSVWRGNSQLISLGHLVIANAQSLTRLHVHIRCSESLMTELLRLVPALEELELELASPHALSEKFFQQFVATEPSASTPYSTIGLPRLQLLDLSYERWLRWPERKTLIPVFGDIVASRQERLSWFRFTCPKDFYWTVHGPVERFCEIPSDSSVAIGISSPHGIVRISSPSVQIGWFQVMISALRRQNIFICTLTQFSH
jgi:hypothetical protein